MPRVPAKAVVAVGRTLLALVAVAALGAGTSRACVGTACLLTWSTEEGGGALTLQYDFQDKVQTFGVRCDAGKCFYSAADPGFMNTGETAPAGFFALVAGTTIRLEVVAIDPAVIFKINGVALDAGESARLGTTPELHTHPSWQLSVPEGEMGDYPLSFKLTSESPRYRESDVFQLLLSNLPTPTPNAPTATATPTATMAPTVPACAGDCDDSGDVTVNELILGVASALDGQLRCPACDRDGDGMVVIGELIGAVNAALRGCPSTPTPTATLAATLDNIQRTIFSPRCAVPSCHTAQAKSGNLVLDADNAYDQLVGVPPSVEAARLAGQLRVDAGHPENSFLLVKLQPQGPPPGQGSRMPLTPPPLTSAEIQLIHDWIAKGAAPQ